MRRSFFLSIRHPAYVGTDFLSALPFLESANCALIIDAVQGGGVPGSIYRLTESEVAIPDAAATAHAQNLLTARRLMSPGARWPKITILGVEPAVLEYGMELSLPVASVLRRVVAMACEITAEWKEKASRRKYCDVRNIYEWMH